MDNMCTVYDLNNRDSSGAAKITRELAGYEGFLSTCRFMEGNWRSSLLLIICRVAGNLFNCFQLVNR